MDPFLQRACSIVWEIDLVRNMGGGGEGRGKWCVGMRGRAQCRLSVELASFYWSPYWITNVLFLKIYFIKV